MKITFTETGILAGMGLIIGFLINCCKQIEGSRCNDISLCYGMINIHRKPFTSDEMIQLESQNEIKEDN
jgi:hypothetical protein